MEEDSFVFPGEEGEEGIGKTAVDNLSGIKYFRYAYNGSIGGDNFYYELNRTEGGAVFAYWSMLHPERDRMETPVGEEILDRVNGIYLSCRLAEWDGYSKYNTCVFDGSGFMLSIVFNDGASMRADGTNAFPKGYRGFIEKLDALLEPISEELLNKPTL